MNGKHCLLFAMMVGSLGVTAGCSRATQSTEAVSSLRGDAALNPASSPAVAAAAEPPARADNPLPRMVVHKNASCGCCALWIEHVREAGFQVEVRDVDNLDPVKTRLGIPFGKGSCHTAEVGGYFVEGHVPAADIKRLLADKPDAKGLVLPGMPAGSPGMERPDGTSEPYSVELVARDGSVAPYSQH